MQMLPGTRRALLSPALLVLAACGGDGGTDPVEGTPPRPPAPNFVQLRSEGGDYVGGGRSWDYTQATARITVAAIGARLSIDIEGNQFWSGTFQAPASVDRLQPGRFAGLQRYPFHDPAVGGMSWIGEGRGCNTLVGAFTVDSVAYAGDRLDAIALRFEQRCDGSTATLRGTIHWRADDTTRGPAPGTQPPAGLWQPPAGATPATGDYVYLESESGDPIGGGRVWPYTDGGIPISLQTVGSAAVVVVDDWFGFFAPMASLPRLAPGYYAEIGRHPFQNPLHGGIDWSGHSRGACNTITGWMAVDRVTWVGDAVTAIEVRFEQHCNGIAPALRGKARVGY